MTVVAAGARGPEVGVALLPEPEPDPEEGDDDLESDSATRPDDKAAKGIGKKNVEHEDCFGAVPGNHYKRKLDKGLTSVDIR